MKGRIKYSSSGDLEETIINLTPLIDVVFVVLITFILVAPLLEINHVDLAMSGEQQAHSQLVKSKVCIYVKEDNTIWLNNRLVGVKELVAALKEWKKNVPTEVPMLFHDKKGYFGTYQLVKNSVESAGYEHMDVIVKPQ
ncbi:MAG: biopolymer transporter ExbD [Parachlamydiales bacterium]|nr:biopolymer transporter ExbD [Parachlamydiales bacterium]